MRLVDFLQFDRYSNRTAVVEQSAFRLKKYSYLELSRSVAAVANSLVSLGISEGDKVILWGENSARWMITFYACLHLKIVVVPIDPSFSPEYVERIRVLTRAKLVCSDRDGSEWNQLLKPENGSRTLPSVAADPADLLQIIFTSGTTGDPKGVLITHANLLANLTPIYDEIVFPTPA